MSYTLRYFLHIFLFHVSDFATLEGAFQLLLCTSLSRGRGRDYSEKKISHQLSTGDKHRRCEKNDHTQHKAPPSNCTELLETPSAKAHQTSGLGSKEDLWNPDWHTKAEAWVLSAMMVTTNKSINLQLKTRLYGWPGCGQLKPYISGKPWAPRKER